jgi:leukotriene-A4 hydrolase
MPNAINFVTNMTTTTNLYGRKDFSSLSNYHEVTITHIKLKWNVDFGAQIFSGSVEHSMKVLADGTKEVHFDSSHIHILEEGIVINNSIPAKFRVEDPHEVLGSRIVVEIPIDLRQKDTTFTIRFLYAIDPAASAVQWLPASATQGGEFPFVFTQSQAIHARSLLPCMDSPAVKATYAATVAAPKWCTVLMSALAKGTSTDETSNIFEWEQPIPTPAYLIALAGGRLSSKDVSDRVRIWAEPDLIDAAHFEFDETEEFLKTAEEITDCPYVWTRYDVLCMPPSFPYGGTENVCLTFATPTLLAGDKSLADVIAHEIAHSWTGNLVTNHTWDHFWLNEGWTVWLERKIISKYKKNVEFGTLSAQVWSIGLTLYAAFLNPDGSITDWLQDAV